MECYSVLAFCYNKYKKYVNKEDKMKTFVNCNNKLNT